MVSAARNFLSKGFWNCRHSVRVWLYVEERFLTRETRHDGHRLLY